MSHIPALGPFSAAVVLPGFALPLSAAGRAGSTSLEAPTRVALGEKTRRVVYLIEPGRGNFSLEWEELLHSELPHTKMKFLDALFDGGKTGDIRTYVIPVSAEELTTWRRLTSGVGHRVYAIEFDARLSELMIPGNTKLIFGLLRSQAFIPDKVALWNRRPVVKILPPSPLSTAARKPGRWVVLSGGIAVIEYVVEQIANSDDSANGPWQVSTAPSPPPILNRNSPPSNVQSTGAHSGYP